VSDNHDPRSGRFTPGNVAALTHGGRRKRALTAQQARGSALYAAWATDLGGVDQLSTAMREVLVGTVAAVLIRESAEAYLATARTPLTGDRAKRALEVFHRAHDAVLRGATALGLERKAKPALDLRAYAAQQAQERE
jgi:hypothetical protein